MIEQINSASGRTYTVGNASYPSITTILTATRSLKDLDKLRKWQHKMDSLYGDGAAKQYTDEAKDRGTKLHEAIAQHFVGEKPQVKEGLEPFWNPLQRILKCITFPQYIEHRVYHDGLKYAGTLDLLAYWRGLPTLIDWKTSARLKKEAWMHEARLQTAAYAGAVERMYGIKVEQTLIVVASPDNAQCFCYEKKEIEGHWDEWVKRVEDYGKNH